MQFCANSIILKTKNINTNKLHNYKNKKLGILNILFQSKTYSAITSTRHCIVEQVKILPATI